MNNDDILTELQEINAGLDSISNITNTGKIDGIKDVLDDIKRELEESNENNRDIVDKIDGIDLSISFNTIEGHLNRIDWALFILFILGLIALYHFW
jgi:archaellum component FlaC